jgi:hypothetical protein
MPLRDHFCPPVSKRSSWEGFHGGWPCTMVQSLVTRLPANYVAEPRVHLGTFYEIHPHTFEDDRSNEQFFGKKSKSNGSVATATWAPPAPSMTLDVDMSEEYAYEVLVFDLERDRELVAAVEIVSPANKDRPESRHIFISKCATLLKQGVPVSIVDLVSIRRFNMYTELLALFRHSDPSMSPEPPAMYAATCRNRKAVTSKTKLDIWASPLIIGQPLPTLPIWLSETLAVSLDLEASYEEACRALRIA